MSIKKDALVSFKISKIIYDKIVKEASANGLSIADYMRMLVYENILVK